MSAMISSVTFEMFFKNLSPYIESDEEFFQLIRDMTGLSSKKPSVQMKIAKNGNGEAFVSFYFYCYCFLLFSWYWNEY